MSLNPLAVAANETIEKSNSSVLDMLSTVGKKMFFPKGILTQSAEAKAKATRYNATIGIATENNVPMYLDCINSQFDDSLSPSELYPYASSYGVPALRTEWLKKQMDENPSLEGQTISNPVVTNALTHGLSVVGELFVESGDTIIMPDMLWGNYRLTWSGRLGAKIETFPCFDEGLTKFNIEGFEKTVKENQDDKIIVVLNFPNNPSGYSPLLGEAKEIVRILTEVANSGKKVIAICDDAYYGMFYDKECLSESIFALLSNVSENLLAIKVDGATKETFVWGLRVGFITYGIKNGTKDLYNALETKTGGLIRGNISNVNLPGQTIVLKALQNPDFKKQQAEKVAILNERASEVKEIVYDEKYSDSWKVYPFNSGYFMCIRVAVDAETLRLHLLDNHGIGVISLGKTDIRVAFSCAEKSDLADLFERIAISIKALS